MHSAHTRCDQRGEEDDTGKILDIGGSANEALVDDSGSEGNNESEEPEEPIVRAFGAPSKDCIIAER